ncbi:VOC family protein [Thalassotalea euphylliae]|uniref:VOC family protein n=1 Tax=Thalassotalea euphylliae TaxID=1655234 RepID=UPI0036373B2B
MMRLEHLNLVVNDIESSLNFYHAAFPHWQIRMQGESEWYGKPRRWLHFGDDTMYLSFSDDGEDSNRDLTGHQIGLAHIGFETSNLDAMIKRLSDAGYEVAKPGAKHLYRKNAYYLDPAGFEVEFVEYLSDVPSERNAGDDL